MRTVRRMTSSLDNRDLRHTTAKLSIQMGSFGCSRGELTHAAPQNVRRFVSRQSVNISVLRLPAPSAFGGSHRNDLGRGWTGSSIDLRAPQGLSQAPMCRATLLITGTGRPPETTANAPRHPASHAPPGRLRSRISERPALHRAAEQ